MEGDFHFKSAPIAQPGTAMLLHERPENRITFCHNANQLWYIGPCLNHYRTFKAIIPSTGAKRMSNIVKTKHRFVAIPTLTPVDKILEAMRQLDTDIKQQPKCASMDKLAAVDLLREVLLGENRDSLPPNNAQLTKMKQQAKPQQVPTPMPPAQLPASSLTAYVCLFVCPIS